MKPISDLFSKYKNTLKAPQKSVEKEVLEVINTTTPHTLTEKQVSYTPNTRTIYLKIPSVLKSEILFHQKEILEKVTTKLGVGNAPKTIL